MVKFGICSIDQARHWSRHFRRGPHSARLLAGADEENFDLLMRSVCLSNGTARTTRRDRFQSLHEELAVPLRSALSGLSAPRVEDWAVSSGTAALAWYQHLRAEFPGLLFTASDWMLYLIEAHRSEIGDTFILEPDGTPIQYVRPPFVVQLGQPVHGLFVVNRYMRREALRLWEKELGLGFSPPGEEDWQGTALLERPPLVLRRLPLLHPSVNSQVSDRFQIRRHSVFERAPQRVHLIRTFNILNRAYFPADRLREAAGAVAASLVPGGLWLVGRTVEEDPARHEASLLRRETDGWKAIWRSHGGSELESVLGIG